MDSILKSLPLPSQTLIFSLLFVFFIIPSVKTNSDYNTLVYKNCATNPITHDQSYSQTLSSLFQELIPHSSQSKFFKTTAGQDTNGAVSGLFQCRGDLTNKDCHDCVNTLPELSNTLCNKAVSARIQLNGCYFHYESEEFNHDHDEGSSGSSEHYKVLHKSCGEKGEDIGFKELMKEAFVAMVSGVVDGNGFYFGDYHESVHVMAQCEGDLVGCDCGECVSYAVQIVEEECDGSVSGQVYMDRCFISYSFYPNEVTHHHHHQEKGSGSSTGKSVAIVLGGVAALGFGFIFLLFLKSCRKKEDDC